MNDSNGYEEVKNSMEHMSKYCQEEMLRINQIYGTQLETVSNLEIPEETSSLEESFESGLDKEKEGLEYFE